MEVTKFTAAEKSASSSQECQVRVDRFFRHPRHSPQGIRTPGQTVNGNFYCEALKQLTEGIRCKCPEKWKNNNWFLHHDNAPAHTSLVFLTIPDFQKHYSDSLPYPRSHSPNLTPCDFFPFPPKIKLQLKGRCFDMTDKTHTESQEVIDTHI